MSNVLNEEKQQQVLVLGRLGWSLRRTEQRTCVRRETASPQSNSNACPENLSAIRRSAIKRRGRERKMSKKPEVTESDGNIFAMIRTAGEKSEIPR
jgi:hypothetical protein